MVWSLGGSARHKIWPRTAAAIVQLLQRDRKCQVLLVGGADRDQIHQTVCQRLDQYSPRSKTRFRSLVASCTMRQSMALAQAADLVVGAETGLLHAVALEANAKGPPFPFDCAQPDQGLGEHDPCPSRGG